MWDYDLPDILFWTICVYQVVREVCSLLCNSRVLWHSWPCIKWISHLGNNIMGPYHIYLLGLFKAQETNSKRNKDPWEPTLRRSSDSNNCQIKPEDKLDIATIETWLLLVGHTRLWLNWSLHVLHKSYWSMFTTNEVPKSSKWQCEWHSV